jgi:hypothetical protein
MARVISQWCGATVRLSLGLAAAGLVALAGPAAAQQEMAVKGAVTFSHLQLEGPNLIPFDDRLVATAFGGHVRFRLGPVLLQPEIFLVTKGGKASATVYEEEQLRTEYIELPLLLALPLRIGSLEAYGLGGGMIALESRCRYVIRDQGLRSNFGCDGVPQSVFARRVFDYGVIAGGGLSYPVATGRVLIEARHTWGMRNIVNPPPDTEARHRTFLLVLGYAISLDADRP